MNNEEQKEALLADLEGRYRVALYETLQNLAEQFDPGKFARAAAGVIVLRSSAALNDISGERRSDTLQEGDRERT